MTIKKMSNKEHLADERLNELLGTRRFCYHVTEFDRVKGQGFRASIVIEGEPGRYPTGGNGTEPYYWGGDSFEEAVATAEAQNKAIGISREDAIAIVHSSMFPKGKRFSVKRSRRSTAR